MSKVRRILSLCIALAMLAAVTAFASAGEKAGGKGASSFEIYFLDVGKGDAAVVLCDGYAMMIDGGTAERSDTVYSFLKGHGISRLDYIICTHPDSDHCGGLAGALNAATAGVVMCTDRDADKKPFRSFLKYLEKQDNRIMVPSPGDRFSLGSASVRILAPERGVKLSDNTSIVLRITYGSTSFLFTGDAEKEDEKALLASGEKLKSTVLKVAHHGSKSSTTKKFLEKVRPEYAVISVGENGNGHPSETVLGRLESSGARLFRTDLQGTVHCVSDGRNVTFSVERNTGIDTYAFPGDKAPGAGAAGGPGAAGSEEPVTGPGAAEAPVTRSGAAGREPVGAEEGGEAGGGAAGSAETGYVANTKSKKFHYPSCPSVEGIKESNRWDFTGTRDDLISMGYEPCGSCRP